MNTWQLKKYYAVPPRAVQLDRAHLWVCTELVAYYVNDYTPHPPDSWVPLDRFDRDDGVGIPHVMDLVGFDVLEIEDGRVRFRDWGGAEDLEIIKLTDNMRGEDRSGPSPIERKVHAAISRLRLPEDWSPDELDLDPHRLCRTQRAARRFALGEWNVRLGSNVSRIYHVLCTSGSRELRGEVRADGEALVSLDIKSAFPFLLAEKMAPGEATVFRRILGGDVYSALAPEIPRPEAKVQFMVLLSGLTNPGLPLHRAFARLFPDAFDMIRTMRRRGRSLQQQLQTEEAEHVVHNVVKNFRGLAVPVHDAVLCRPESAPQLTRMMSDNGRFQIIETRL